jgi:hypothetical protein
MKRLYNSVYLKMGWKLVDVMDEIAESDGGPIVGALGLEWIPLDFVAERVDRLTELLPVQHPVETTAQREIAS